MKKITIVLIIIGVIAGVILMGVGLVKMSEIRESYSLDNYTCEQIEGSIREGVGFVKSENWISMRLFTAQEKFVYYTLFCINNDPEVLEDEA